MSLLQMRFTYVWGADKEEKDAGKETKIWTDLTAEEPVYEFNLGLNVNMHHWVSNLTNLI